MVDDVRAALAAAADPAKAAPMQAYMKSTMPNLGVQKPARVAALRSVLRGYSFRIGVPGRTPSGCCGTKPYREERYAATDLARYRTYREWATDPAALSFTGT